MAEKEGGGMRRWTRKWEKKWNILIEVIGRHMFN